MPFAKGSTSPAGAATERFDMITAIRQFFERNILEDTLEESTAEHGLQLATAALLIEMSRADFDAKEEDKAAVSAAIGRVFGLDADETEALVALAEQEANEATSLYQFTSLINRQFSADQKAHVVELLWQVAYADGRLDKYEEHLVRKIADLIHVPHSTFIQAKHKAKKGKR